MNRYESHESVEPLILNLEAKGGLLTPPPGILRPMGYASVVCKRRRSPVIDALLARFREIDRLLERISPSAEIMQSGTAAYDEAFEVYRAMTDAIDNADEAAYDKAEAGFRVIMEPWCVKEG
ncbi:MAG: hypothetical protein HQK89_13490 [Nitrospirae bacterium]|nr:hypothetical protein [Nitrospirota bacterium]